MSVPGSGDNVGVADWLNGVIVDARRSGDDLHDDAAAGIDPYLLHAPSLPMPQFYNPAAAAYFPGMNDAEDPFAMLLPIHASDPFDATQSSGMDASGFLNMDVEAPTDASMAAAAPLPVVSAPVPLRMEADPASVVTLESLGVNNALLGQLHQIIAGQLDIPRGPDSHAIRYLLAGYLLGGESAKATTASYKDWSKTLLVTQPSGDLEDELPPSTAMSGLSTSFQPTHTNIDSIPSSGNQANANVAAPSRPQILPENNSSRETFYETHYPDLYDLLQLFKGKDGLKVIIRDAFPDDDDARFSLVDTLDEMAIVLEGKRPNADLASRKLYDTKLTELVYNNRSRVRRSCRDLLLLTFRHHYGAFVPNQHPAGRDYTTAERAMLEGRIRSQCQRWLMDQYYFAHDIPAADVLDFSHPSGHAAGETAIGASTQDAVPFTGPGYFASPAFGKCVLDLLDHPQFGVPFNTDEENEIFRNGPSDATMALTVITCHNVLSSLIASAGSLNPNKITRLPLATAAYEVLYVSNIELLLDIGEGKHGQAARDLLQKTRLRLGEEFRAARSAASGNKKRAWDKLHIPKEQPTRAKRSRGGSSSRPARTTAAPRLRTNAATCLRTAAPLRSPMNEAASSSSYGRMGQPST
uniref:Uncharacterized protein n=1 Tax=Mycena chlorophos TaxID=658473 RepID=A0ABQ0M690_MYCCL|nr:predicted protein [Mycena chlorophos]